MKAALAFLAWIFITCHIALGQDPVKQIPKDTTVTILPAHKIPLKPEHRWGDAGVGFGIDYGADWSEQKLPFTRSLLWEYSPPGDGNSSA